MKIIGHGKIYLLFLLIIVIGLSVVFLVPLFNRKESAGASVICNYHGLNEYHLWLKIDEATTRDYEVLEITGYSPSSSGVMTKSISKTIDLTQYIPVITDTAKTFPTRIGPDWHEAYIYDNILYVHLQSGFQSGAERTRRVSISLILRNLRSVNGVPNEASGTKQTTKEQTLPVKEY